MASPIPAVPASPEGLYTQSRIGVVTSATTNSMLVNVGGTVIEVAFIHPFTTAAIDPPDAGTVVQLIRQDASWIAVGRVVGVGSNSILNGSFENSGAGAQPINWTSYNVSGVSTASVVDIPDAPEGDLAVLVSSAQASVHFLYSDPIPVNAGEIWSVSATVGGNYSGGAQTADAALLGLWFANATDLYPTTSSADILITQDLDLPQYPPFHNLFQNVTVPVSGFMRIALRSTLAAGQGLVWDNVISRRV